jgi:hypothetical protein
LSSGFAPHTLACLRVAEFGTFITCLAEFGQFITYVTEFGAR